MEDMYILSTLVYFITLLYLFTPKNIYLFLSSFVSLVALAIINLHYTILINQSQSLTYLITNSI